MWGKIEGFQLGIDDNDEFDHGVHLGDPNIIDYRKKLRLVFGNNFCVRGIRHVDV